MAVLTNAGCERYKGSKGIVSVLRLGKYMLEVG